MTLAAGLALWALAFVLLPQPLVVRITLAGPLLVVPTLLAAHPAGVSVRRLGGWWSLSAAVPLMIAFALPISVPATLLTLPWLALTIVTALLAGRRAFPVLRRLLDPGRAPELGALASLGFLGVGAAFLTIDRAGLRPFEFPAEIILLTGTHFHFAGFGLLTLGVVLVAGARALT
ncbi:MAG: YndJ family protein, partial [Chloroflexota bacterium]|nr:YndJ family protein [Chloroflexota bacterium]